MCALGAVCYTVHGDGTLAGDDHYDPWGMELDRRSGVSVTPEKRYKFAGKEKDVDTVLDCAPNKIVVGLRSLILPDFVERTRRADVAL